MEVSLSDERNGRYTVNYLSHRAGPATLRVWMQVTNHLLVRRGESTFSAGELTCFVGELTSSSAGKTQVTQPGQVVVEQAICSSTVARAECR
eukprot:3706216-Pyramimonas_sp.AAC.1